LAKASNSFLTRKDQAIIAIIKKDIE